MADQAADDPVATQYAAALATNLRTAMNQTGYSTWRLAADSGVTRSIITRVLAREGLPNARAVAHLETTLGVTIWPGLAGTRLDSDRT
jgi:ribosome-binding protein aMBF1 (putative translation factor)